MSNTTNLKLQLTLAQIEQQKAIVELRLAKFQAEKEDLENRMARLILEDKSTSLFSYDYASSAPYTTKYGPVFSVKASKASTEKKPRVETVEDLVNNYQISTNQMIWKLPNSKVAHWDSQCQHLLGRKARKSKIELNMNKNFCQTCYHSLFN